jgi:hypothetical protein
MEYICDYVQSEFCNKIQGVRTKGIQNNYISESIYYTHL